MLVYERMIHHPMTVHPNLPVAEALRLMREENVRRRPARTVVLDAMCQPHGHAARLEQPHEERPWVTGSSDDGCVQLLTIGQGHAACCILDTHARHGRARANFDACLFGRAL